MIELDAPPTGICDSGTTSGRVAKTRGDEPPALARTPVDGEAPGHLPRRVLPVAWPIVKRAVPRAVDGDLEVVVVGRGDRPVAAGDPQGEVGGHASFTRGKMILAARRNHDRCRCAAAPFPAHVEDRGDGERRRRGEDGEAAGAARRGEGHACGSGKGSSGHARREGRAAHGARSCSSRELRLTARRCRRPAGAVQSPHHGHDVDRLPVRPYRNANATYASPDGSPSLPPPQAITTYCRPFTS